MAEPRQPNALIASVETFCLSFGPDGTPLDHAPEYAVAENRPTIYPKGRETLFVKVTSASGAVGWGEGLAPVAPRIAAAIVTDLLAPSLIGADAANVRPLRHRLGELMRERGHLLGHQADALAAVDIAVWDLLGQVTGLSVAALLGGAFRYEIPSYVTSVGGTTDAERADRVAELHSTGVQNVKLHLGNGVAEDLATFDAVANQTPAAAVAVDAHCVYDLPDALRLARGLDSRGAWFLESALAAENLKGHAELAAAVDLPIAGGEALRNHFEAADWIAAGAYDYLQPDIGRTGITEGNLIATLAEAAYRPILPHHSAALGVALAAGLHVAAAAPNAPFFEYGPSTVELANRLLRVGIRAEPDRLVLPDGPGLGIEVDEDAVRASAYLHSGSPSQLK